MVNEAYRIPRWLPVAMVAALGASTLAGAGLGISESPSFTSPPNPIEASCLVPTSAGNGLPGPNQDLTAQSVSQLVEDLHHTDFFVTDEQADHGIDAKAMTKYNKVWQIIRGGAPPGVFPKHWGPKQDNEMNEASTQLNIDIDAGLERSVLGL